MNPEWILCLSLSLFPRTQRNRSARTCNWQRGKKKTRFVRCLRVFNTSVLLESAADVFGNSGKVESCNIYGSGVCAGALGKRLTRALKTSPACDFQLQSFWQHDARERRTRSCETGPSARDVDGEESLKRKKENRKTNRLLDPGNMDKSRFVCECGLFFCRCFATE